METGRIGYPITSLLPHTEDSNPIFSVIPKTERVNLVPTTPFGRRYGTVVSWSGSLSGGQLSIVIEPSVDRTFTWEVGVGSEDY